ncbi:MAG: citrate transporter [Bacteroidota bacterium]
MMTAGILIVVIFLIVAALMFLRKLPTILALPLMAIAIGFVEVFLGHLSVNDLLLVVVADGSQRLIEPMIITMFGGMLSVLLQKSGVAERLVKMGAEFAGSNPFVVAAIILFIVGILFTTITGLGAVIMVSTIALPILASVGLKEEAAGGIMLFGISLGGLLNLNNWAVYKNVLSISPSEIYSYAFVLFLIQIPVALLFVVLNLWRAKQIQLSPGRILRWIALLAGFAAIMRETYVYLLGSRNTDGLDYIIQLITAAFGVVILLFIIIDKFSSFRKSNYRDIRWYNYLIPIVPLILILVYRVHFVNAFFLAFIYGVISTLRKDTMRLASRSIIEGVSSVVPVIVLMIGIGMLLSAILGPAASLKYGAASHINASLREWPVVEAMKPLFMSIVPTSFWSYVIGFGLLAPLALYRGPMNVWGLGYGVAGILLSTGQLNPPSIMGVLMSLSVVQGISDPTNTQNVWIANELRVDVNLLMWRTLPYAWLTALFGLLVAGLRFLK